MLSNEEIDALWDADHNGSVRAFARAIEAAVLKALRQRVEPPRIDAAITS